MCECFTRTRRAPSGDAMAGSVRARGARTATPGNGRTGCGGSRGYRKRWGAVASGGWHSNDLEDGDDDDDVRWEEARAEEAARNWQAEATK